MTNKKLENIIGFKDKAYDSSKTGCIRVLITEKDIYENKLRNNRSIDTFKCTLNVSYRFMRIDPYYYPPY